MPLDKFGYFEKRPAILAWIASAASHFGPGAARDRPAHHNVVGAVPERLLHVDRAFLVVDRLIRTGANPRRDDQKFIPKFLRAAPAASMPDERINPSQPISSARLARDSTTARISFSKPRDFMSASSRLVSTVTARIFTPLFFGNGGAQHLIISVHGGKCRVPRHQLFHCIFNGFGDIEKLQVDEHLAVSFMQPVHQIEIAVGHE